MSVRAAGLDAVQRLTWLRQAAGTSELTEAALRVAIELAGRQNSETGRLNPSVKRLADDTGLATRSVRYAIKQLEGAGLLEVRRSLGGSSRNTSQYRLKPGAGVNHSAPLQGDAPVQGGAQVQGDTARDASHCRQGVHHDAPKQGIEQGKNRGRENARGRGEPDSRSPRSKHGRSRLRDDWALPYLWREWAEREMAKYGVALDIELEAENFRDYWAGPDAKNPEKADWERTWRTWVRRSMARRKPTCKAGLQAAPQSLPTLDVDE